MGGKNIPVIPRAKSKKQKRSEFSDFISALPYLTDIAKIRKM